VTKHSSCRQEYGGQNFNQRGNSARDLFRGKENLQPADIATLADGIFWPSLLIWEDNS